MVFKYKIPEQSSQEDINYRLEKEKSNILEEHTFLSFIGSSCIYEAEDELNQVKTLMLTFDDPD